MARAAGLNPPVSGYMCCPDLQAETQNQTVVKNPVRFSSHCDVHGESSIISREGYRGNRKVSIQRFGSKFP